MAADKERIDFEKEERRLDEIIARLGDEKLKIDEAVALYKEGTQIVARLKSELESLKAQVTDEIDG